MIPGGTQARPFDAERQRLVAAFNGAFKLATAFSRDFFTVVGR